MGIFFYAVMFLFCLTDLKRLWIIAAVFLALIALNIYFFVKHKNDKPNLLESALVKARKNKKLSAREKSLRKQRYEEFLDELDEEFDYDDELGDDDDYESEKGI